MLPEGFEGSKAKWQDNTARVTGVNQPWPIKVILKVAGNSIQAFPDRKAYEAAFNRAELVVDYEIRMTDTAKWADYVLLDVTGFEKHGIDEPAGTWPDVKLSWMPMHTKSCTLCGKRIAEGKEPFCTYNCSTKAMTFGDLSDPESAISKKMEDLKGRGFKIFQQPYWEQTRTGIYYAQR
jgi:anaerobic selenocysteine-containing dehydrogenase